MLGSDKAVLKYLERYCTECEFFPVTELLTAVGARRFKHVLIIPAYHEAPAFLARFMALKQIEPVLLVLVVNAPETADPSALLTNRRLGEWLAQTAPKMRRIGQLHALHEHEQHAIVWIDCFSQKRLRQGVGEARKIGCDIGLRLIVEGIIQQPVLFNSDADAHLPDNFFDFQLQEHESAGIAEFKHLPNPEWQAAIDLYEIHLRHYVTQLRNCGSPYAYHSIGSLLAISARHYALARGMPLREAGEDFYLLNKLAKLGKIMHRPDIRVGLDTRPSERVPFGTGPAIRQIARMHVPAQDYLFYHPGIFTELKQWLSSMPGCFEQDCVDLPEGILTLLKQMKTLEFIGSARRQFKQPEQFLQALHTHFDAFKTLKAVHWLRAHYYPSVTWQVISDQYGVNAQSPAQLLAYLETA